MPQTRYDAPIHGHDEHRDGLGPYMSAVLPAPVGARSDAQHEILPPGLRSDADREREPAVTSDHPYAPSEYSSGVVPLPPGALRR